MELIDKQKAIYIASGYCHWSNIPKELEKLPTVQAVPIPDNATNGDVIKAMFPDATIYEETRGYGYMYSDVVRCAENYMLTYDKEWWNAPYKRSDAE